MVERSTKYEQGTEEPREKKKKTENTQLIKKVTITRLFE